MFRLLQCSCGLSRATKAYRCLRIEFAVPRRLLTSFKAHPALLLGLLSGTGNYQSIVGHFQTTSTNNTALVSFNDRFTLCPRCPAAIIAQDVLRLYIVFVDSFPVHLYIFLNVIAWKGRPSRRYFRSKLVPVNSPSSAESTRSKTARLKRSF